MEQTGRTGDQGWSNPCERRGSIRRRGAQGLRTCRPDPSCRRATTTYRWWAEAPGCSASACRVATSSRPTGTCQSGTAAGRTENRNSDRK
ncbi:Hypothetical protein RMP42_05806 (plasmid) [Roseomonas mucosa]|nr:Hypothetical protein RMP42_05806 [Roseomonas mucosa]